MALSISSPLTSPDSWQARFLTSLALSCRTKEASILSTYSSQFTSPILLPLPPTLATAEIATSAAATGIATLLFNNFESLVDFEEFKTKIFSSPKISEDD